MLSCSCGLQARRAEGVARCRGQKPLRRGNAVKPNYVLSSGGFRAFACDASGGVVAWFVAVERWKLSTEDTRDFLGGIGAKDGDIRDSVKRVVVGDTGNVRFGPVECVAQFWLFKSASLLESRGRSLFLASSSLLAPYRPTTSTFTSRNPPPYDNTDPRHTCNHGRPLRSSAPLCGHYRRTKNPQLRAFGLC